MTSSPEPPEWRSPEFVPLSGFARVPEEEMVARAESFRADLDRRRTVRDFDPAPVPRGVIERCLLAAGTAPSGAHRQPWRFVVIEDADIKHRLREAAEAEEREFYAGRAPEEWLAALAPLGTTADKPFLETAPVLIAIFAERFGVGEEGGHVQNYYVTESVGIATGMLIAALHQSGLATLTHTPSPMGFLNTVLDRPKNERPFLLLVVGYPAPDARVPKLERKSLEEIAEFR